MASDPLNVVDLRARLRGQPLVMEFPVDRSWAPFLVSSPSSQWVWVSRASRTGMVRAGIRHSGPYGDFYREIISEISRTSEELEWGNSQPLTQEGLSAAIEHVASYGFGDLEILAPPGFSWGDLSPGEGSPGNLVVEEADWLPEKCLVVLPEDRSAVGFLGVVSSGSVVGVILNPSRGIAIVHEGLADESFGPDGTLRGDGGVPSRSGGKAEDH